MKEPQWDGKVYRPVKFGEGRQPGTVESEKLKRQRRAEMARFREERAAREEAQRDPLEWFHRPIAKVLGFLLR